MPIDEVVLNDNLYTTEMMKMGGVQENLFPMMVDAKAEVAKALGAVTDADDAAEAAAASALDAAASAISAASIAAGATATSTTSLTIGTGSKAPNIGTGKQFAVGQFVYIARTSAPTTTWMYGQVASYTSGVLTVTVSETLGSGTFTDWTVSVAGVKGSTGATGTGIPSLTGNAKKQLAVNTAESAAVWLARAFSQASIFTSGGTFTPDANVDRYFVFCQAGGAGGNMVAGASRGGQAGQCVFGMVTITSAQTVTVGAGGAGVTNNTGNAGSDSSVGTLVVAKGGAPHNSSVVNGGGTVPAGCVSINGGAHTAANADINRQGGESWFQPFLTSVASRLGSGGVSVTTGTGGNGGDGIVMIFW